MTMLAKAIRLGPADRALLLQAAALHTAITVLLRLAPFGWVVRRLESIAASRNPDRSASSVVESARERRIVWAHTLRNALLPVVTMAGLQTGGLLGGSVIVETVFGWPGLGLLAFQSLFARDLNLLLGIFFLSACTVVVVNLAVDILYTLLDPRIEVA